MDPVVFSALMFAGACAATLLGAAIRRRLPQRHLDPDSRDVVKLVMSLVSTMSAITLGLLVSSAQGSFTAQKTNIQRIAADVIDLDRTLRIYGPEAGPARALLREGLGAIHDAIWIGNRVMPENLSPSRQAAGSATFQAMLRDLQPKTEMQQLARNRAVQLAFEMGQIRLVMFEAVGQSISWYFIVALALWIFMLFTGYGLLTQAHATVAGAWALGALSIAVAMFLILELNEPYSGIIQLSDTPLRNAIAEIGQ